jgi:SulP family sulfate permease
LNTNSISRLKTEWFGNIRGDILAGLVVALALIPEAIAFSIIAGVDPKVGLYASFSIAVVVAITGGRPGMISAATAATAVLMVTLVKDHGLQYLLAATVLAGLIQIMAGFLRVGYLMRFISKSVMTGFVNALAILIFLAQLPELINVPALTYVMLAGGLAIIYLLPLITRMVPSPLICIIALTAISVFLGLDLRTVGDMGELPSTLPIFLIPDIPLNIETFLIILPYSAAVAAVGLLESLMTATIVDELTDTRSDKNRECIGQGIANTATGFIGGMAGCAMIGQSMINIKSGGRTRLSGITAALCLLAFILVASGLIEQIPLAALVGVMFMVVIGTFAWQSLRILRRIPLTDALVMGLVTAVTVMSDLAIAVIVGVIVSALAYAWSNATRIHATTDVNPEGAKVYQIEGPLFFGSADGFAELFDQQNDPDLVIVDFLNSRVVDQSALQAIEALASKYEAAGKSLQLRHLSHDCHRLLNRAGQLMVDSDDDPNYGLAVDYSIKTGMLGGAH